MPLVCMACGVLNNRSVQYRLRVFFFFQAEDGIRDLTVTGVQTCALPIYDSVRDGQAQTGAAPDFFGGEEGVEDALLEPFRDAGPGVGKDQVDRVVHRSEERRVGKECRSRWSPYH